jgi:hypothetical protein
LTKWAGSLIGFTCGGFFCLQESRTLSGYLQ